MDIDGRAAERERSTNVGVARIVVRALPLVETMRRRAGLLRAANSARSFLMISARSWADVD
jgi:hypothetical protein